MSVCLRAGRGEPREGTEDLETALRANQLPPFQPAWLSLSFSRPRLLYEIPVVLCEHPRHPTLTKKRYRVVGVRSDENVLVVNQANRTVSEQKEIVEMVVAMAHTMRMLIDGHGKLVEPPTNGWGRHRLQVVTKKPELEPGQFPTQASAIQRRIPRRQVGRLEFCQADQGGDKLKTELSAYAGRGIVEDAFRVVRAKIFEHCPPLARIVFEKSRYPQTFRGTPRSDIEVPFHLTSNMLWIPDEDRGPVLTIPKTRVAPTRGVTE